MSDSQFQDSLDALLDVPFPRVADPAQVVAEVDATLLGGLPLGEVAQANPNQASHLQGPVVLPQPDKMLTDDESGIFPVPVASWAAGAAPAGVSTKNHPPPQGVDLSSLVQLGPSSSSYNHHYHMNTSNLYVGKGYSDCKSSGDTASTTSSDAAAAPFADGVGRSSTRKRNLKHRRANSSSHHHQQNHHHNNKPSLAAPAISEDEIEARKRRSDRNAREQARSQKIADQIAELHSLLEHAAIPHQPDKYHTLLCTAHYIRQLQQRATDLQQQHEQLLKTLQQASQHVNQQYVVSETTSSGSSTANAVSVASSDAGHIAPPVVVSSTSVASFSGSESVSNQSNNTDTVVSGTSTTPEDSILSGPDGINHKWIFDCSPFASAVTSIDGRFLECNQAFEHMSGYHRDELFDVPEGKTRNMSIFNILERQHIERVFAPLSEILQYNEETRRQQRKSSCRDSLSETVDLVRQEVVPHKTVRFIVRWPIDWQ